MTAFPPDIVAQIEEHIRAENMQDLPSLLDGMTEDCYNLIVCDPVRLYSGPAAVERRYRALWAAFPDLAVKLRRVVAATREIAVSEHLLSGTHRGNLFDFAPTGKRVEVETIVVWEIVDGRIRGETVYFDLATMLRQIGVLTLPSSGDSAAIGLAR